jgi:hypothetical protein
MLPLGDLDANKPQGILELMNSGGLPAEAHARQKIDADLRLAGWII